MAIEQMIIALIMLLAASLFSEPVAQWLRLPHTLLLVFIGFIGSELVLLAGYDTGLRADTFQHLVVFVFLPILIFEAAFAINAQALIRLLLPIMSLAIIGVLLTTAVIGAALYYAIGHPQGFPWSSALLAGVLLAATDPVAVVTQLKSLGAPERLAIMLEGESLFNDATAIVLFSVLLLIASGGSQMNASDALLEFLRVFLGGAAIGAVIGLVGVWIMHKLISFPQRAQLTLLLAYGSFSAAEIWWHVSGVMAVLICGLLVGNLSQRQTEGASFRTQQPSLHERLHQLWGLLGYLANGLLFLLMGITITLNMFTERYLAMMIGIFAILLARGLSIPFSLAIARLIRGPKITLQEQRIMHWGGLRGAITLVLALSLPTSIEGWWTIQSIAYGVVIFTLLVQAPSMPWLLRKSGLNRKK
ncbi:cation:proton antiporter [Corallincola spongiicola]|uniref:Sodium:proton antiporter n=1 Tax=Corallincola spongiicola TaxID=2520508 RepID=A0ABY1WQM3_9GAMM|nr:sodium:proton antiporter [Corallincola spongiicola]TAA47021.1 sodium:proton antiporter [Corallincola spongiicola]